MRWFCIFMLILAVSRLDDDVVDCKKEIGALKHQISIRDSINRSNKEVLDSLQNEIKQFYIK